MLPMLIAPRPQEHSAQAAAHAFCSSQKIDSQSLAIKLGRPLSKINLVSAIWTGHCPATSPSQGKSLNLWTDASPTCGASGHSARSQMLVGTQSAGRSCVVICTCSASNMKVLAKFGASMEMRAPEITNANR